MCACFRENPQIFHWILLFNGKKKKIKNVYTVRERAFFYSFSHTGNLFVKNINLDFLIVLTTCVCHNLILSYVTISVIELSQFEFLSFVPIKLIIKPLSDISQTLRTTLSHWNMEKKVETLLVVNNIGQLFYHIVYLIRGCRLEIIMNQDLCKSDFF